MTTTETDATDAELDAVVAGAIAIRNLIEAWHLGLRQETRYR